ncbi:hypothetical protein Aiant_27120 [Actinoplanes ianthinogenes]|uniref:Uncharacterized protein n=2 Tax=Actinoplanes ianthinogenes TaxID=122358 RepID=A0ABM7LS00_9ACTN|nr:hypothetical protein Aiant_27120 [Actinoplanes ianthinogenes]
MPPTTALIQRVLAAAAEVLIVEAPPDKVDDPDAARLTVTGARIDELSRLLAIEDGGNGDRCRCRGWPTILVRDAGGAEIARWSLHHQTGIRAMGDSDADLLDGRALSGWLAQHGLTGSLRMEQRLAEQETKRADRRLRWLRAAPPGLAEAAEPVSRSEEDAEERLAALVARRYPDAIERIRALITWAGFSPRQGDGGTPWHELAPHRLLLTEPQDLIFTALAAAPLGPAQLDGVAELVTALEWNESPVPEPLRAQLIEHVTATGTDPMRFRMRHGYGRPSGG